MFVLIFFLSLLFSVKISSSSLPHNLKQGLSLSVENNDDILISKNGVFSAGFYKVGENVFCFSIWYTHVNDTVVWMANRDRPVNGKHSKLSLQKSGDLILKDAGASVFWSIENNRNSSDPVQLQLNDTGNLVFHTLNGKAYGDTIWQSFESPTNTLLPNQGFTRERRLVASKSRTNHSSGFYKLIFSDDNILSLVFNGLETDSVYWPDNNGLPWEVGRSNYNESRRAVLDSFGYFLSTDKLNFTVGDYGLRRQPQRRLVLDPDGNIRVYSLNEKKTSWDVQWQAFSQACKIHGICGENSLCSYEFGGRKCSCLPGYKMRDIKDWSNGCEPEMNFTCNGGSRKDEEFIQIPHVEFTGYAMDDYQNYTLDRCKKKCSDICSCIAFNHLYNKDKGLYVCSIKALLLNGYRSSSVDNSMYIKLPKSVTSSSQKQNQDLKLTCSPDDHVLLDRVYKKKHKNRSVQSIFWFTIAFGGFEIFCILVYYYKARGPSHAKSSMQNYHQVATGFSRFTYADLKKASRNFSEEIGIGGGGIVYKALLPDDRVAAIKRLNNTDEQGEAEFLAEVNIIGRLNHMNLIEIWGYCAEAKHRLLVYEYMEHGSLAENLHTSSLDWEKRYQIAVGTAKGLAYLHDECLEWVLHCDVKPENILLDSDYRPKISDFGLSKLLNRGTNVGNSAFSKIRGTRGYMAPEWVYNLSITSKVDVYSYGIVMLELITGRSPTTTRSALGSNDSVGNGGEPRGMMSWVREKTKEGAEIVDPKINGAYNIGELEVLLKVALQCAEDEKDARPSMSQVVDMLRSGHD
ncbi:putative receptor protein kinase ZmPK1 [Apium graveolens]|uniref:putative receptor protein kinase ZmPK1 n=1 Tax=Apium graveolens TaxID=4045 RepID=UPI003D79AFA9